MKKQHTCARGRGCAVCPTQLCWRSLHLPPCALASAGLGCCRDSGYSPSWPLLRAAQHTENSVCRLARVCDQELPWKSPRLSTLPLLSCAFDCFATGRGFLSLLLYSAPRMFLRVPRSLLSDDTLNTVKQDTPWAWSAHQLLSSKERECCIHLKLTFVAVPDTQTPVLKSHKDWLMLRTQHFTTFLHCILVNKLVLKFLSMTDLTRT